MYELHYFFDDGQRGQHKMMTSTDLDAVLRFKDDLLKQYNGWGSWLQWELRKTITEVLDKGTGTEPSER